jgi:hypothetical protein
VDIGSNIILEVSVPKPAPGDLSSSFNASAPSRTPRGRVCYDHKHCRYWRNTSYVVDEGDSDESDSESCL